MSIVNKVQSTVTKKPDDFTKEELEFIIAKLQESNYRGYEFEKYYQVYRKLVDKIRA
jgi:proline dehydrogenase